MEPLTVTITAEMAERIRDAAATGRYASASELTRDALAQWELGHDSRERALAELRVDVEKGLAAVEAGRLIDLDVVEIVMRDRQNQPLPMHALPDRG